MRINLSAICKYSLIQIVRLVEETKETKFPMLLRRNFLRMRPLETKLDLIHKIIDHVQLEMCVDFLDLNINIVKLIMKEYGVGIFFHVMQILDALETQGNRLDISGDR